VEPLKMTKIPENPWTHLSDFCGPFPTGEYLLVVINYHSRFPVVEFVHSTSAKSMILKLDKIFSLFGIPEELKTDNGPPFQSADFAKYADYLGFQHRKITSLWSKANGTAERFM
jgi:putative transposase